MSFEHSQMMFGSVVEGAIALNKLNRLGQNEHRGHMGDVGWGIEMCTVRLDVGRQTGKTHWALSQMKPGVLLVVRNYHVKKDLVRRCQMMDMRPSEYKIMSLCEFETHRIPMYLRGMYPGQAKTQGFTTIIIDEPYGVRRELVENVYRATAHPETEQQWVILGGGL